jgi:hypothetical protein
MNINDIKPLNITITRAGVLAPFDGSFPDGLQGTRELNLGAQRGDDVRWR